MQQTGSYAQIWGQYGGDALVNDGTIAAGFGDGQLVISMQTFTNNGILLASNNDTLNLSQVSDFTNLSGGVLTSGTYVIDTASDLELTPGQVIVTDMAAITLDGAGSDITTLYGPALESTLGTIAAGGTLALLDGRDFVSSNGSGTFVDAGVLQLGAETFSVYPGTGEFDLTGGTITGTGTVEANVVVNGSNNLITGGAVTIDGNVSGGGALATRAGNLVLAGSTVSVASLSVSGELSGFGTVTSAVSGSGLIDATGGTLAVSDLTGLADGVWSGGEIEADGNSSLLLANDTGLSIDAAGITLSGAGATIAWLDTSTGTYDSLSATLGTIAASGTLALLNGQDFTTAGTLTDAGTLLLGGGTLTTPGLVLQDGATIEGSGTIDGPITLDGNVVATGGTLVVNGPITGTGTVTAGPDEVISFGTNSSGGGPLLQYGTVQLAGGTFDATSLATGATAEIIGYGTISGAVPSLVLADANGGTLVASGLGTFNGDTLTAGQLEADANSVLELAADATIATDAGSITLSGAGSLVESLDTASDSEVPLDTTLAQIAAGGTLALLGGRSFAAIAGAGTFVDSGVLTLDGGTFAAAALTISASGSLWDSGTVVGTLSDAGTVTIDDNVTLTPASLILTGGVVSGEGTLEVLAGNTVSGSGTISSAIDINGTVIASGGTLVITGPITSYGTLSIAAGAVLEIADGGEFGGTVIGAGSLINDDLLDGFAQGVSLSGTGTISVTNTATGAIDAATDTGLTIAADTALVDNDGAISGSVAGLSLSSGSTTVTNTGLITGDTGAGILVGSDAASIDNTGVIASYESPGAALDLTGTSSAVVINAGTIIGNWWETQTSTQIAVQFGSGDNLLVVDPGAAFVGSVLGGSGANTLELAAGTSAGTLSGLGSSFVGFTDITEDAGASWSLTDSNSLSAGASIDIGAGSTLAVSGSLGGAGTIGIEANAVLSALGTLGVTGGISFLGDGTVDIGSLGNFSAPIIDFDATDVIDLLGSVVTGDSFVGNTLTLSGAGGTLGSLTFQGNYTGHTFGFQSDGHGGSIILLQ
jgi:hypothetical protein